MVTFRNIKGEEVTATLDGEEFFHADCMELLKALPDDCIDLALLDPPYGHILNQEFCVGGNRFPKRFEKYDRIYRTGGSWSTKYQTDENINNWDIAPGEEYWKEIFRVSKNQIVWGGNYFTQYLPPSRCFVVWHKLTISDRFSMAMAEYAWASFPTNAKLFSYAPQGNKEERFHPTSKPVALYEFCLQQFAKPGQIILDTHAGSGSSLIACHNFGCKYIASEISDVYYKLTSERIKRHSRQNFLFNPTEF